MTDTSTRSLSREDDHLGVIRQTLVELGGYATMAFELIQNSDDNGATTMRFDVRGDALIVEDDGGFSDCDRQDLRSQECPFLAAHGHQCDFHSFRLFSGANKRRRADTTGAMGIGFTAVYQITDYPTVASGKRSWRVDETAESQHRIIETDLAEPLRGTRLELPWARDEDSRFRRLVDVPTVPADVEEQVVAALHEVVPPAVLFLRNITRIELARNGEIERTVTREEIGDDLVVGDNLDTAGWRILKGSFASSADNLKTRHQTAIEGSRRATVRIAIPHDTEVVGLLCATLPTRTGSGLPAHVDADFVMSRDRRRPLMSTEFAADWNSAALDCAAATLAEHLDELTALLPAERLWALLESAWRLREPDTDPAALDRSAFWDHLGDAVSTATVVATYGGPLVRPRHAYISGSPDDVTTLDALTRVGIHVTDPGLRPFRNVLLSCGVAQLTVGTIGEALEALALPAGVALDQLPTPFDDPTIRAIVWAELARLVTSMPEAQRRSAREVLSEVSFLPSTSGTATSIGAAYVADAATRELFGPLIAFPFVNDDALPEDLAPLLAECDQLTAVDAIDALDNVEVPADVGRQLVTWFARRDDIGEDSDALANLRIFPVAGLQECARLPDVSLPGVFEDVLEIALLVDLDVAMQHKQLLVDLGAEELTLKSYIQTHVANALDGQAEPLTAIQKRRIVDLLARHWLEVSDDDGVRATVNSLAIVETVTDAWVTPAGAYQDTEEVRSVLGSTAPIARSPAQHPHAFEAFLRDLDVAHEPRPEDVATRVQALATEPVSDATVGSVEQIVSWLADAWHRWSLVDRARAGNLRNVAWLPRREDDAWHLPRDLDLEFQRPAFASQGAFVRLPLLLQQRASAFLQDIGLSAVPTTQQVVDHLLHCAATDAPPNSSVYATLNARHDDNELDMLSEQRCLHLGGRWLAASEVFWSTHHFGEWRLTLSGTLIESRNFLDRLGVSDEPDASDAVAVLRDIASKLGPTHDEIADDDQAVVLSCWRMCEAALTTGELAPSALGELRGLRTVCDERGVLMRPTALFFEDLPRLASKFPQLRDHIIRRPDGATVAMTAAGLRNLSEAATGTVVDLGDRVSADAADRVITRAALLARLISANGAAWLDVSEKLARLSWVTASTLTVAWELEERGHRHTSDPEDEHAFWDSRSGTLYTRVAGSTATSWNAVARELLRAVWPDVAPSAMTMALAALLQASDVTEAGRVLDEAGVPYLADELAADVTGATAGEFDAGDGLASDDHARERSPEEGCDEAAGAIDGARDGDGDSDDAHGNSPPAPGPNSGDASGGSGQQDDRGGGSHEDGGGERGRGHGTSGTSRNPGARSRLRSYVAPGRGDADESHAATGEVSEIDRAGVAAVVDYEAARGRGAEVMAHNNPGYDIRSFYEDGELARWIEVKSTAGSWDVAGVALSPTQFEFARRADDGQCWLYVVEFALSDGQRRVWAIPDPVDHITEYAFDDGWKALAEPTQDSSSESDEHE